MVGPPRRTGVPLVLQLEWIRAGTGAWFTLDNAPIADIRASGVYLIWIAEPQRPSVLRVDSGNIGVRLTIDRLDPKLRIFAELPLFVTWATVADHDQQRGIVRYLSQAWGPVLFGDASQAIDSIPVNLPPIA